jgi:autotransporter-associated beta strand protein
MGLVAGWSSIAAADLTWGGGEAGVWKGGGTGWLDGVIADTWDNAAPDNAIFSGALPTAISVDSLGVTAGNLTFSSGLYTFNGPGTLALSNSTVQVGGGLTTTVNVALSGTSGMIKSGDGVLSLAGNNKSYSGTTVINGGAIQISAVGNNILGASSNGNVTLNGGALYGNFSANVSPGWVINVGSLSGELRNLAAGRWLINQNDRFTGSGALTLSFGTVNTRYELTAAQNTFAGKWVLDSAGNNNRFFDIYSGFAPGSATGDDVYTLRQASLLLRAGTVLGSATQGILLTNGTSRISIAGGASATLAGRISGGVNDHLEVSVGNATAVAILSNTNNSWLGNTLLRTDAASGDVRGIVRLGASGVLPDLGGNITINTGVILDLNGFNETIGGLAGAGRVISSTGAAVLRVGSNNNSPTFTGVLADDGGVLGLTKVGDGIQALAGANSYSGDTLVLDGTLKLNSGASISNTPSITVAAGAAFDVSSLSGGLTLRSGQTLSGEGEVIGSLTVGADATLSPGSSPGFLTVDALTLAGSSRTLMEINGVTTPGTDYDWIQSDSSLTYQSGWILRLSFGANIAGTHTIQLFDFASYNGTANAPTIEYAGTSGAASSSYNESTGEFTFTDAFLVPEPSTLLLMGLGVMALGWKKRKC